MPSAPAAGLTRASLQAHVLLGLQCGSRTVVSLTVLRASADSSPWAGCFPQSLCSLCYELGLLRPSPGASGTSTLRTQILQIEFRGVLG